MADTGYWSDYIITAAGRALRQRCIAEGKLVVFTRAVIGEGVPADPADIALMTEPVTYAKDVIIKKSYATDENHLHIVRVDNSGYTQDVLMSEVAVYAKAEDEANSEAVMYGYAYKQGGYVLIPQQSSATNRKVYEITLDTHLSAATEIQIVYDESSLWVSHADLDDAVETLQGEIEEVDGGVSEHNVSTDAHQDIRTAMAGKADSAALTAHNSAGDAHQDIRNLIAQGQGVDEAISTHNANGSAHQDIRTLIAAKPDAAAITTAVNNHNTATAAHADIRAALADKANLSALDATRSAIETIENKLSGENLALGKDAAASITGIVIGAESSTNSSHAIVVGNSASSTSAGGSVTIGYTASSGASGSIATGSIAIGQAANCAKGYSVALGFNTRISGEYSTALGPQASIAESDSGVMQLGSTSSMYLSALRCRVGLSQTSDERDKADIAPISAALDFIQQVQPIQYVDNARVKYLPPEEERTAEQQELMRKYGLCRCYDEQAHAAGQQKGERKRVGVSAQQVQDALAAVYGSADYANIVNDNLHDVAQREELPEGVESQLTVNYSGFVPFLIQAVQELARRVEELEARSM